MNRSLAFHWKTFFVAPLVVAGIVAALWLAVTAAYENIRFVRATDLILGVIAVAHDMAVDVATPPERATASLFERLSHLDNMHIRAAAEGARWPSLINPWGGRVNVEMLPSSRQLRLQTALSPVVCRRMILFYAKDAPSLGVQRVEAHDEGPAPTTGRMIYDGPDDISRSKLDLSTVRVGCGEDQWVTLILTIRLQ